MNAALLTVESRKRFFVEHDLAGLMRGDIKARYEAFSDLKTRYENGELTEKIHWNRKRHGDTHASTCLAATDVHLQVRRLTFNLKIFVLQTKQLSFGRTQEGVDDKPEHPGMVAGDYNAPDHIATLGTFASSPHELLVFFIREGVPGSVLGLDLRHDRQNVQQAVLNSNRQDLANDDDMFGFGRMCQWPFTIPIEVRQVVPNHARGDLGDIVLSEIADQTIF